MLATANLKLVSQRIVRNSLNKRSLSQPKLIMYPNVFFEKLFFGKTVITRFQGVTDEAPESSSRYLWLTLNDACCLATLDCRNWRLEEIS